MRDLKFLGKKECNVFNQNKNINSSFAQFFCDWIVNDLLDTNHFVNKLDQQIRQYIDSHLKDYMGYL